MKTTVVFAAFLIAMLSAANAGSIAITVTAGSGACAGGCTKNYTDTDANLGKIVSTYQIYCNAKLNAPCSPGQVITFWMDQLVANTVSDVTSFDKTSLQNAATSNYTPINPK